MEQAQQEHFSVAAPVTDVGQIAPSYRTAFERVVEEALRRIFQRTSDDALKLVTAYFQHHGGSSVFTYQHSPMQIAADLAGAASRELTADEKDGYNEFLTRDKDVFGLPSLVIHENSSSFTMRTAW